MLENHTKTLHKFLLKSSYPAYSNISSPLQKNSIGIFTEDLKTSKYQKQPQQGGLATSRYTYIEKYSDENHIKYLDGKKRVFVSLILKVKQLQEQKKNIMEELESTLANFSYIIDLLSENLCRDINQKVSKMFSQKDKTIFLLTQRLKKCEKEEALQEKYEQLEFENQKLKNDLAKFKQKYIKLLDESRKLNEKMLNKQKIELQRQSSEKYIENNPSCGKGEEITSETIENNIFKSKKLKKQKTVGIDYSKYVTQSTKERKKFNQNIKSLDKIKQKISRLKEELTLEIKHQ